jgi:preprotein translocase subunit SecG
MKILTSVLVTLFMLISIVPAFAAGRHHHHHHFHHHHHGPAIILHR